jgi:hypothetical protein
MSWPFGLFWLDDLIRVAIGVVEWRTIAVPRWQVMTTLLFLDTFFFVSHGAPPLLGSGPALEVSA